MFKRCLFFSTLIWLLIWLIGCQSSPQPSNTPLPATDTPLPEKQTVDVATAVPPLPTPPLAAFGYTYQQPDGNHIVYGQGNLPAAVSRDIPLRGVPVWLSAVPMEDGSSMWAVILADETVQVFFVAGTAVTELEGAPVAQLALPPLLFLPDGLPAFVVPPSHQGETHPIILPSGGLAVVDENLVVREQPLPIKPLPDARILVDERERLLLLSDPTDRYAHGVLGDPLEAGSFSLVETQPEPRLVQTIEIENGRVIEGIAPIWVDWNGDGQREIIVTLSDASEGAQIVLFSENGEQLAAGPAVGRGGRWRHQIAVAPFGPNGEMELVDVLTPHIGGIVEFYQWQGNELKIVAEQGGFTSHVIATNNLDMAAAGDFDGDGRFELLLPTQDRSELGAVHHTTMGAEVAWTVPLDGRMVTNLGAVTLANGRMIIGIGRDDGSLRLWLP